MERFSVDAYTPQQIAAHIQQAGVTKSSSDPVQVFVLAMLAGAFIALGAVFFTLVTYDSAGVAGGLMRLIGGVAFCLGLILVVVAGAELFTGNNLIVMACVDGQVSLAQLLKNWLIVYLGNFVGALGILVMIYFSGHWLLAEGAVGSKAIAIAHSKVNLDWIQAFFRGILCNVLVCLAVWLCYAGRSVVDKVLAILFPITAFVAMGFEHSVANMYFIPAGLVAKADPAMLQPLGYLVLDKLTISGFLWHNLIPVTLGNMLGGGLFVGLVYWFIYLRKNKEN
ncbi:formate/nitrite transporter family protein [Methylophaga sp. OBS4]|uniref:formate/nitrite transporter family protein n=1 Tax=Methylophaga sp. OBS4 TaxID=2991935 RepID=UPI00224DC2E4|nr:formate transporter FocA [Methylophaga sp. OBS4]MCX4187894.1 formate/nitrite transporter family protein [Methylophaga sp. OBS4]